MLFDRPSPGDGEHSCAEPAGAPSAEALFAMRVAGEVARQLYESGRELRFVLSPSPARVEVLLCDVDGIVLSRMTPSRALAHAGVVGAIFLAGGISNFVKLPHPVWFVVASLVAFAMAPFLGTRMSGR